MTNCAIGTLSPYIPTAENPWDSQKALHLVRRMVFSGNPEGLNLLLALSPTDIVDLVIDEAINLPLSEQPQWAYWTVNDYEQNNPPFQANNNQDAFNWAYDWLQKMSGDKAFREKLTLFWHNHFVTRIEDYTCASWLYQYHKLLQEHCLGNFKTFVYEMGKTPAMLVFLNGVQNTTFEPNENYARELYELFTLGLDNGYTQEDITETG